MHSIKSFLIVPLLLGVLFGCNDDNDVDQDEVVTDTNKTGQTENTQNVTAGQTTNDQNTENTQYNFTHFDLDVDYANDFSYDVEYNNNQDVATAEIDDEINKVELKGDDANNQLAPQLKKLTFDENSTDEEVVNEVLSAFELEDNYQNIELEVKFNNGDVKRYNFKK
ncbi:YusW-like protein [Ureibacillus xyleni]|uniref:YusW-like protein n=1 Tax=Ureibacillus xyleni TaxID=614648 RepID=A0A285RVT3_9BACL|nr:YusW family protein [Ureibacillus xyleni]SOB98650.1 YusW-like protein [Ureibacillus xyleni]